MNRLGNDGRDKTKPKKSPARAQNASRRAPRQTDFMNENERYIADHIRVWARSGFYSLPDIYSMIEDIMEADADERMLREFAESELRAKLKEEAQWLAETDCDRLDKAFDALNNGGVIALQNAGFTMSEGYTEVTEALAEREPGEIRGYCFFHGQDLERAINGNGLTLAFGDLADTPEGIVSVGELVKKEFEKHGFTVDWDGNPEKRIDLPNIVWQRRTA